jgi:putative nucleotidyltransferase with HDIG domain
LVPIVANAQPTRLLLRVLDKQGQEVLAIDNQPGGPTVLPESEATYDYSAVENALAGRKDAAGDRYVFIRQEQTRPVLYWSGPVRTDDEHIVGVILVGQALAGISAEVPNSVFYDLAGHLLASSIEVRPDLSSAVRAGVTGDHPVLLNQDLGTHFYGELFSDWTMRGQSMGYLAVLQNADQLQASIAQVRLFLILVFVLAAFLTLVVGGTLAARITRPLEQLVRSMRAVSAGDLRRRATVGSKDEIGYLATTFNEMTAGLQEKTRALEDTYFASMEALARAIDARDASTFGHSTRVAAISLEIANGLLLPPDEREALRRGALLHDIGKIGVQDRVLRKAGLLNEEEAKEMREHPLIGYEMLRGLPFLEHSLSGVRHHHERWDGRGYPDGLAGIGIPLRVRILSVADVLDAITSDRPYRAGLSLEAALETIVAQKGKQFDPDVVDALVVRTDAIKRLLTEMGRNLDSRSLHIGWRQEAS